MVGIPSNVNTREDLLNLQQMAILHFVDIDKWIEYLKSLTERDTFNIPLIEKGEDYFVIPEIDRELPNVYQKVERIPVTVPDDYLGIERETYNLKIYGKLSTDYLPVYGSFGQAERLNISQDELRNMITEVTKVKNLKSRSMSPAQHHAPSVVAMDMHGRAVSSRPLKERYIDTLYNTNNDVMDLFASIVGAVIGEKETGIYYIQDAGTKLAGRCYIDGATNKLYMCNKNTTATSVNSTDFEQKNLEFTSNQFSQSKDMTGLTAPNKKYIVINGDAGIKILAGTTIFVGQSIFKVNSDLALNSSNLDTGSFAVGKDYYVYCCDNNGQAVFKISLNSTYPSGFNANNSRKIGGFHYGDNRRVNATTLEPINSSGAAWGTNWEDNVYVGILPFSIWSLQHRPKCPAPEGMVYCDSINKWVDIYLLSTNYRSEYNATPITGSEGLCYWDWHEKIARRLKKFPLTYLEFCSVADGSPNGRDDNNDYAWSKTTNTARNKTGIIAKAVSSYGLKDCSGNVWEVGADVSWSTQPGSWGWKNQAEVKKGAHYAAFASDVHVSLHGANWDDGSYCGSRALICTDYLWNVHASVGGRLACDSL